MMKTLVVVFSLFLAYSGHCGTSALGVLRGTNTVVIAEEDVAALASVATEVIDRSTNVAAEAAARITLGTAVSNAVATEVIDRSTNVAAEVAARIALGTAVSNAVATETSLRIELGTALSNAVATATDALRLTDAEAKNWIDGTGGVWRVVSITNEIVSYVCTTGYGSVTEGETWIFNRTEDGVDYYLNNTFTNITYSVAEAAWAFHLGVPYYSSAEARNANTLTLENGNVDEDIVLARHVDYPVNISTNPMPGVVFSDRVPSTNGLITVSDANASYLSSTPGWFWQGSQAVVSNGWTTNLTGYAVETNRMVALLPYTETRHDVTGTCTVVAGQYIVSVASAVLVAASSNPAMPRNPVKYSPWTRLNATSFVFKAWCSTDPFDVDLEYYAYVSNIVVTTFDRSEMAPAQYTNDTAGIVARVDDLPIDSFGCPITTNSHARTAVNAQSVRRLIDYMAPAISRDSWHWTPSGRRAPSAYTVTVDQPLVQQGQMSWLQSGDYWCMSYAGGDWYNVATGSVWRIGASGRVSIEIAATNHVLHISGFSVAGGYATIDIATNWVTGTPVIEFTDNLNNQQWLTCPAQDITNAVTYWRAVCPAVATNRFFRAVDPSGDNVVRMYDRLECKNGLTVGTNTFSTLSELKAILDALP